MPSAADVVADEVFVPVDDGFSLWFDMDDEGEVELSSTQLAARL